MGNWHISIQGVGCHHNNNAEYDVDRLVREFVQTLKIHGHIIERADFTFGAREDVTPVRDINLNDEFTGK